MIKKILKSIWKEFIFGGHFQSLGAVSIILVSGILLNIRITWHGLVIIYLIFYPLYLYNRYKEINIDATTNPERTQHFKKYLKWMPIILYTVIILAVAGLAYFNNIQTLVFGLLLLIFGLLYTTVFKKITRKIAFFKNFYVALFFATLVFFAVVYHSETLTIAALLFFLFVYFKSVMMQIFLDIKDIESDKKDALITLPVKFGKKKIFNILKTISLLTTILIPILFSIFWPIFPKSILFLLFTIPFNFYCFKKAKEQKYFAYILGSGEFVLWLILILIGEVIL